MFKKLGNRGALRRKRRSSGDDEDDDGNGRTTDRDVEVLSSTTGRVTDNAAADDDDDDEYADGGNGSDLSSALESIAHATSTSSLLSFDHDEADTDVAIKVKKSAASRRLEKMKRLEKKEAKVKLRGGNIKEEDEPPPPSHIKSEPIEHDSVAIKTEPEQPDSMADVLTKLENEPRQTEDEQRDSPDASREDTENRTQIRLGGDDDENCPGEKKPSAAEDDRLSTAKLFSSNGGIPDAHIVYRARKQRQMARRGEIVPVDDTVRSVIQALKCWPKELQRRRADAAGSSRAQHNEQVQLPASRMHKHRHNIARRSYFMPPQHSAAAAASGSTRCVAGTTEPQPKPKSGASVSRSRSNLQAITHKVSTGKGVLHARGKRDAQGVHVVLVPDRLGGLAVSAQLLECALKYLYAGESRIPCDGPSSLVESVKAAFGVSRESTCAAAATHNPYGELSYYSVLLAAPSAFLRSLIERRRRQQQQEEEGLLQMLLDEGVLPRVYASVLLHALYTDTLALDKVIRDCPLSVSSLSEVQAIASGKCQLSPVDEATQIYHIAKFLEFDQLAQAFESVVASHICLDSLPSIYNWSAESYGSPFVRRQCVAYLVQEFHRVANPNCPVLFDLEESLLVEAFKSDFVQPLDAYTRALTSVQLYGDERDTIVQQLNQLAAKAGATVNAYHSASQPAVELSTQHPFNRFQALVYNQIPSHDDADGLVELMLSRSDSLLWMVAQIKRLVNALGARGACWQVCLRLWAADGARRPAHGLRLRRAMTRCVVSGQHETLSRPVVLQKNI